MEVRTESSRIESCETFIERALDGAIAAGEQADRPVRTEDQAILAETFCGMCDNRKQTLGVPIIPDRFGGEA